MELDATRPMGAKAATDARKAKMVTNLNMTAIIGNMVGEKTMSNVVGEKNGKTKKHCFFSFSGKQILAHTITIQQSQPR